MVLTDLVDRLNPRIASSPSWALSAAIEVLRFASSVYLYPFR